MRLPIFLVALLALVPAVARAGRPRMQDVDLRDYVTISPVERTNYLRSIDGYRAGDEWVVGILDNVTHNAWITDYLSRGATPPYLIGVRRNMDPEWDFRCFSNVGGDCVHAPATYPPQGMPIQVGLPVLDDVDLHGVTAGAELLPEYCSWRGFDVHNLDPQTCAESAAIGTIYHRVFAFVLSSFDFGGTLGAQSSPLVIQEEEASRPDPGPGEIMIGTYIYALGWGRAEEASYDARVPGGVVAVTRWNIKQGSGGSYRAGMHCPLSHMGTW